MDRLKYRGDSFIIERGAGIRPVAPPRFSGADLVALLRSVPAVDSDYLDVVEELTRSQTKLSNGRALRAGATPAASTRSR